MRIRLADIRDQDKELQDLLETNRLLYLKIQEDSLLQFNLRIKISKSGNLPHWEVAKLQREYTKRTPMLNAKWQRYNSYKRMITFKYETGYLKLVDKKRDSVIQSLAKSKQIREMHEFSEQHSFVRDLRNIGLSMSTASSISGELEW